MKIVRERVREEIALIDYDDFQTENPRPEPQTANASPHLKHDAEVAVESEAAVKANDVRVPGEGGG